MQKIAKFIGLDVHKDTITIAWAEGGPLAQPVLDGTVKHDVSRLLKKLLKLGEPEHLWVAYEAGPTGFGLARFLQRHEFETVLGKIGFDEKGDITAPSFVWYVWQNGEYVQKE